MQSAGWGMALTNARLRNGAEVPEPIKADCACQVLLEAHGNLHLNRGKCDESHPELVKMESLLDRGTGLEQKNAPN